MKLRTCTWFAAVMVVLLQAAPVASGQSAIGTQDRSMYIRESKSRTAIMKNDIVLVIVEENDVASNGAVLDARRKTETDLLIDSWVKFEEAHLEPDFTPQPEIEIEGNQKVTARGKTDRRESLRMRIAARVVDVRPNGNVLIEARKERRVNDERSVITLTGEVRSKDVLGDYSILSDRIVDLKLSYTGTGSVSGKVAWTWLTWLIDHIWPFQVFVSVRVEYSVTAVPGHISQRLGRQAACGPKHRRGS